MWFWLSLFEVLYWISCLVFVWFNWLWLTARLNLVMDWLTWLNLAFLGVSSESRACIQPRVIALFVGLRGFLESSWLRVFDGLWLSLIWHQERCKFDATECGYVRFLGFWVVIYIALRFLYDVRELGSFKVAYFFITFFKWFQLVFIWLLFWAQTLWANIFTCKPRNLIKALWLIKTLIFQKQPSKNFLHSCRFAWLLFLQRYIFYFDYRHWLII